MRRLRSYAAIGAVVIVLAVVIAPAGILAAPEERRPDLQVALSVGGRCGEFAESLPALTALTGAQPGDEAPAVTVCLRNRGKADGRLTLFVIDRVERETACSSDEGDIDATCGGSRPGELGPSLVVRVARLARCRAPESPLAPVALPALGTSPLELVPVLPRGTTECVVIRLAYTPASDEAAAAAQTDGVTWRYAFDLTG
jgi:hypothetical protein